MSRNWTRSLQLICIHFLPLSPTVFGHSLYLCTFTADNRLPLHQQAQAPPPTQVPFTPASQRHSRQLEDARSPEGSVIAPSHSASQVARRAAGYPDDYSDDGAMSQTPGNRRDSSIANPPIVEEDETRGHSSDDEGMDSRKYQVHINKPITPKQFAEQKARERQGKEFSERQQQNQSVPPIPPMYAALQATTPVVLAPTQQIAPRPAAPATLTNSAGAGGGLSNGIRKRMSTGGKATVTSKAAAPAQNGRETNEERQKRFSTLPNSGGEPYNGSTITPSIVLPSASQYTVEAHRKKNAPEATLLLPSSDARTSNYRAMVESDEETDEVGDMQRRRTGSGVNGAGASHRRGKSMNDGDGGSITSSRKLQKNGRNSVYYDARSDGGTSALGDDRTERGGAKRSGHEKSRSEGSKGGQGGFLGTFGSLFKKRDLASPEKNQDRTSKSYGQDDDDDTPPTSPKSRRSASAGGGGGGGGSLFGGKKSRGNRNQDDSDSDAPDPKSLVRVVNNPNKVRPVSTAFSDMDAPRQLPRSTRDDSSNVWVPPHLRKTGSDVSVPRKSRKTMSDVGVPRSAPATATKRKSIASQTPQQAPIVSTELGGATGTIKKKKVRPASTALIASNSTASNAAIQPDSSGGYYDPAALVTNIAQHRVQAGKTSTFNPAQRVTQDTPSLMAAFAPPSQSALVDNMPLPSAKNPSRGISSSATMPVLGTLPPPSVTSNSLADEQPLKKKKSVKRSSTISSTTGGALKPSATAPNLAPSTTPGAMMISPTGKPARSSESVLSFATDGTERRKSVRLASTKMVDAKYENAGGPARFDGNRVPSVNGTAAPPGILKGSNGNGYNGEWGTRIGSAGDISSDEEGDEYAKIRHKLSRTDKEWQSAGAGYKGKGRA